MKYLIQHKNFPDAVWYAAVPEEFAPIVFGSWTKNQAKAMMFTTSKQASDFLAMCNEKDHIIKSYASL